MKVTVYMPLVFIIPLQTCSSAHQIMKRLLLTELRLEPERAELFRVCLDDHGGNTSTELRCCSPRACFWLQLLCLSSNGRTQSAPSSFDSSLWGPFGHRWQMLQSLLV